MTEDIFGGIAGIVLSLILLYGAFFNPKILTVGRRAKRFVEAFGITFTRIISALIGIIMLPIALMKLLELI